MNFLSDNAAPVHPAVWAMMQDAASSVDTYDSDAWSGQLDATFSRLFERDVTVLWVATGTAANGLALAALCPPYGGILCHGEGHILADECGAPGFFTGGASLLPCDGIGGKIAAAPLRERLAAMPIDQHSIPARCLSITNATEYGLVYSPAEMAELGAVCHEFGLRFHIDGARFANAVASLGCTPAELTWRAGADILSFGFSKNGGMHAEALVLFDPALAAETRYRRKRAGQLSAKGRFFAAQLLGLMRDEIWLTNARAANAAARQIGEAAGLRLAFPVEANEVFVGLNPDESAVLRAQGFAFHERGFADGHGPLCRFVAGWHHTAKELDPLARALAALDS
jgi:threonine aldolase